MKMLNLLSLILVIVILAVCSIATAAESAAIAVAPAVVAPSMIEWFVVNKAAVFGCLLGISELLSLTPGFKGNGIFDTILKALTSLSGKEQSL